MSRQFFYLLAAITMPFTHLPLLIICLTGCPYAFAGMVPEALPSY